VAGAVQPARRSSAGSGTTPGADFLINLKVILNIKTHIVILQVPIRKFPFWINFEIL
jgi:hypothetical protein